MEQIAYIGKLELSLVVLLKDRGREDLSVYCKCYDTEDNYFVHDTIIYLSFQTSFVISTLFLCRAGNPRTSISMACASGIRWSLGTR